MRHILLCVFISFLLFSCSSKEERRDDFLSNGSRLESEGKISEARIEARNAIKLDPNHAGAYLLLARCAVHVENWREAYAGYTRASELDPANTEAWLGLGRLHLLANDTAKVEELAKKVLSLQPVSNEGRLLLAGGQLRAGHLTDAERTLREVLSADKGNEDALLILSSALFGQGRKDEALALVDDAIAAKPESRALHFRAAGLAVDMGELPKAEKYLLTLKERDPKDSQALRLLAGVYERMGDAARAQEALRDILSADPGEENARLQLMEFLARAGKVDAAVALAKESPHGETPRIRLAVADMLRGAGRTEESDNALIELAGDAEAGPMALEARLRLSEIKLRKGDKEGALHEVDEILRQNPGDTRGHAARGRILLVLDRPEEALGELRVALHDNPADVSVALLLARTQAVLGDSLQAVEGLRDFLAKNPEAQPVRLELAAYLDRQNKENEALEILAEGNEDSSLILAMGDIEARRGRPREAEGHYRRAASTAAGEATGLLRIGNLQASEKNWAAARASFESVLAKYPQVPGAAEGVVAVDLASGKPEKALEWARTWSSTRNSDPLAADLLGRLCLRLKDADGAESAFREAQRRAPDWSMPQVRLARLYATTGRLDGAISEARTVLQRNPEALAEAMLLGQLLQLGGKVDEAESIFRGILERRPDFLPAANNLAYLMAVQKEVSQERLSEALALAAKAGTGGDPSALDTLGWIHYRLGDRPVALVHLRKAHEALPDDSTVGYHLAQVLSEDGKQDEARTMLSRLLKGSNDFPERQEAQRLFQSL
jgi:tetratricopeptide (TPR) repeat protein